MGLLSCVSLSGRMCKVTVVDSFAVVSSSNEGVCQIAGPLQATSERLDQPWALLDRLARSCIDPGAACQRRVEKSTVLQKVTVERCICGGIRASRVQPAGFVSADNAADTCPERDVPTLAVLGLGALPSPCSIMYDSMRLFATIIMSHGLMNRCCWPCLCDGRPTMSPDSAYARRSSSSHWA